MDRIFVECSFYPPELGFRVSWVRSDQPATDLPNKELISPCDWDEVDASQSGGGSVSFPSSRAGLLRVLGSIKSTSDQFTEKGINLPL